VGAGNKNLHYLARFRKRCSWSNDERKRSLLHSQFRWRKSAISGVISHSWFPISSNLLFELPQFLLSRCQLKTWIDGEALYFYVVKKIWLIPLIAQGLLLYIQSVFGCSLSFPKLLILAAQKNWQSRCILLLFSHQSLCGEGTISPLVWNMSSTLESRNWKVSFGFKNNFLNQCYTNTCCYCLIWKLLFEVLYVHFISLLYLLCR
jgi:hypothetical protein